jgi:hypothetical protein
MNGRASELIHAVEAMLNDAEEEDQEGDQRDARSTEQCSPVHSSSSRLRVHVAFGTVVSARGTAVHGGTLLAFRAW